jgi:hypothetical protein
MVISCIEKFNLIGNLHMLTRVVRAVSHHGPI